jgi:hypothetical protein
MTRPAGTGPSLDARYGKVAIIVIVLLAALVISAVVRVQGWQQGWKFFGVSAHRIPWLDLRVISGAVQTSVEGGNPYLANPHDPVGRLFNYPSLWLHVLPGNLSPAAAATLALVFAAGACLTVLAWAKSLSLRAGVFVGFLLVSPSLLLAVERGNTDLAMFVLTGTALILIDWRHRSAGHLGVVLLLLASLLKLFPVVGLMVVAILGPVPLRRTAQFAAVFFLAWIGLHWSETIASVTNTQIGAVHSYGRSVLPFAFEVMARAHGQTLDRAPLDLFVNVLAATVVAAMGWFGLKFAPRFPISEQVTRQEMGWLTGASIYALTFLAGSNFNYRLWFLLLALPWLFCQAREPHPPGRWAQVALGSFFVLVYASAVWWVPLTWLAQTASWLLFASIVLLLAGSTAALIRRTCVPPQRIAPANGAQS